MNRKYLILLALAAALVGCAKDSEMADDSAKAVKNNTKTVAKQPVLFGAYINRATTRAGEPGVLVTSNADTSAGEINLQDTGFGVFAYYTDDDLYSSIYQPNFMYNTKVSGAGWDYSPLRYWPNEFGSDASSVGVDRLSFFAYAPHVDVTPSTGLVTGDNTYGIVGLSRNAATGDPWVKYYASLDPSKQVDCCWGVDKTTGKPIIDLTKQGVSEKVEFAFNHALAALNVQIDAAIDQLNPGGTLDANTKIYVRSVTFEGFVTKGAFNLNTDKATWYDLAGANYIDGGSVTIFDGRTNGKEGQSESVNEAPLGLNPVIVQSQPYSGTPTAGVTPTAVNLFNASATAPLYVIPSGQPLNVTIVYDVETKNPDLTTKLSDGETYGTSVENKITKTIKLGEENLKLEAGKLYTVNLHLGMTSVKFDATVSEWDESTDSAETYLPDNIISMGSIGSIELSSNNSPLTALTVWKNVTSLTAPDVKVMDTNGNPLGGSAIRWQSDDTSVASVAGDGAVTLNGVSGTAKITATATREDLEGSATASYYVYVNEVTSISVAPATSTVNVGGKATLTATITYTILGTVGALPTISWVSGSTGYVTVSPSTGNSTEATGVAEGSSTITASIDGAYMKNGVSNSASATVKCDNSPYQAFRGYWVSPGILYNTNGNYGLTNERDGNNFNPFELYSYYNKSASLNQYYFKWGALQQELGADGSNINSDSANLPGEWFFPSSSIWETIFNGVPKTEIKIGSRVLGTNNNSDRLEPYAYVTVNDGTNTYRGVLLLRDGAVVNYNLTSIGKNSECDENQLTLENLQLFLDQQCLFICFSGYYNDSGDVHSGWKDLSESYSGGFYWSCTYAGDPKYPGYYLKLATGSKVSPATRSNSGSTYCIPVRLVKPATGPMY